MKERIRQLLHTIPFQPFVIHMADGRQFRVEHPDFVLASPKNQSWVIVEEPDNDLMQHLAAMLITGVEYVSDASIAS